MYNFLKLFSSIVNPAISSFSLSKKSFEHLACINATLFNIIIFIALLNPSM